jgi:cytoskeletal protein CcmA (bactofilin family)
VSCASDLYVAGHIDGEMDCETLTVTAGGLVSGSINAGRLNMEAGGRLEGDLYADTMGIKGDAILTARILCRGTQGRGASQERAPVERRKRDSLHALAHPLPAE